MAGEKKVWKLDDTNCTEVVVAGNQVHAELTRSMGSGLHRVVLADETVPAEGLRALLARLRGGKRDVTLLKISRASAEGDTLPNLCKLINMLEKVYAENGGSGLAMVICGAQETLRLGAFASGMFTPCEYVALLPSSPKAQLTPPISNYFTLHGHPMLHEVCITDMVLCDTSAAEWFSKDDLAEGAAWAMAVAVTQSASLFGVMGKLASEDDPLAAFKAKYDEIAKTTISLALEAGDELKSIDFLSHLLMFPGPGLPPPGGGTSIAIAAIARISSERGAIPAGEALRICQTLERFGMPIVSDRPKSLMQILLAELQKHTRELRLLGSVGGMSSRTAKPTDILVHL